MCLYPQVEDNVSVNHGGDNNDHDAGDSKNNTNNSLGHF